MRIRLPLLALAALPAIVFGQSLQLKCEAADSAPRADGRYLYVFTHSAGGVATAVDSQYVLWSSAPLPSANAPYVAGRPYVVPTVNLVETFGSTVGSSAVQPSITRSVDVSSAPTLTVPQWSASFAFDIETKREVTLLDFTIASTSPTKIKGLSLEWVSFGGSEAGGPLAGGTGIQASYLVGAGSIFAVAGIGEAAFAGASIHQVIWGGFGLRF